jgi:hypothetical protein
MLWLDKVGGLMMGPVKFAGDTEITRPEFDALFEFEPVDRHAALPVLRRQAEYDAASVALTNAVVDEVAINDELGKAVEELRVAQAEAEAAPAVPQDAEQQQIVEWAQKQAVLAVLVAGVQELTAKATAASEAARKAQAALEEIEAVMATMPPRRSHAVVA